MTRKISQHRRVTGEKAVRDLVEREYERTGGIFRLAPAWVGRPGVAVPGRRIRLGEDSLTRDIVVNERWFSSVTFSDNGVFNTVCPDDHGLSYLLIGDARVQLKEALEVAGRLLLGPDRRWNVLPKFFDNRDRLPFHLHPCGDHVAAGLVGKPESYFFPEELNTIRHRFPHTTVGVDPAVPDGEIARRLLEFLRGDNRLTDLGNAVPLVAGTGYHMPACTLHAPGSLVTYELQVASDVTCLPESRANDMGLPTDLLDRDLPVKVARDGLERVMSHVLAMINCPGAGNRDDFRRQYFRAPVATLAEEGGTQSFVIYRTGRAGEARCPDLYSAKRTVVHGGGTLRIREHAAFGAIALGGHGTLRVPGRQPVVLEAVSFFPTRDDPGGDEVFVAAGAAAELEVEAESVERLSFYQHFASDSNPEAATLAVP
jgi:hypothetical protein